MKKKETMNFSGKLFIAVIAATILFFSCDEDENTPAPQEFTYEFNSDTDGWTGGFADYPAGNDSFYEMLFEYTALPEPLDHTKGALKISGNNHSDDLFMFVKRKISGLQSSTVYHVEFTVEFASNVADDSAGVGGSPGEGVYIKAGASTTEPRSETDESDWYRMNIDKANQAQSGADMIVIGDFSNDTDTNEYALKTVSNSSTSFTVTSNENGEAWLIVGTDSAFEATTTIYFNQITFVFSE
ncbi:hypothetical protein GM418_05785 [Maribellus comscasis]|uniref:Uncharacterized protein n=1 Tax=Maribellus comscasis TaxID=2681766 RepID=A0A6I6JK11_9BACT|nr:hypothetical protein [Maribellus comscasis]QGY43186.1 hypothetical protein GM418_05785 [Maribellus comscasis]